MYACLDDDVQMVTVLRELPLKGRPAVIEWWSDQTKRRDETEIRPLDYEATGECVLIRGYLRHRAARQLSESQVFWLYEIRDGKVVRMESHPSRSAALAAAV